MNDRLANGAKEIASENFRDIRLLTVKNNFSDHPLEEADMSGWTACTPDTVRNFSTVAYFFGRELSQADKLPIGIIHVAGEAHPPRPGPASMRSHRIQPSNLSSRPKRARWTSSTCPSPSREQRGALIWISPRRERSRLMCRGVKTQIPGLRRRSSMARSRRSLRYRLVVSLVPD